jgi:hypothetical protein
MFELKETEAPLPNTTEGSPDQDVEVGVRAIALGQYRAGRYASRQYDRDQEEPEEIVLPAPPELPNTVDSQDPKEAIAALRRLLAERDHALLKTALINSDLKQELDETKTATVELKQQLTTAVKTNESLTARAAEQAASTKGNAPTADEVLRMKAQFRRAQKALEKEYSRVKDELVRVKGEAFRATQQLEIEARARRAEAAQASVKIAAMQQQMEEVAKASFAEATSRSSTEKKTRLWVGLGSAAGLAMLAFGLWTQFSGSRVQAEQRFGDQSAAPETVVGSAKPSAQGISLPGTTAAGSSAPAPNSTGVFEKQASFQRALSRLNNTLSGPIGRTPEQLLKDVRLKNALKGERVCDFDWNGGQPALLYSAGGTLDGELNKCSAAVEQFLAHK